LLKFVAVCPSKSFDLFLLSRHFSLFPFLFYRSVFGIVITALTLLIVTCTFHVVLPLWYFHSWFASAETLFQRPFQCYWIFSGFDKRLKYAASLSSVI
jgi:hypothetical protein